MRNIFGVNLDKIHWEVHDLLSGQGLTTDLEGQLTLKVNVKVTHIR
jgi:hypothetical protein